MTNGVWICTNTLLIDLLNRFKGLAQESGEHMIRVAHSCLDISWVVACQATSGRCCIAVVGLAADQELFRRKIDLKCTL